VTESAESVDVPFEDDVATIDAIGSAE